MSSSHPGLGCSGVSQVQQADIGRRALNSSGCHNTPGVTAVAAHHSRLLFLVKAGSPSSGQIVCTSLAPSTPPLGRCAPPLPQPLHLWANAHHLRSKHSTSGQMHTTFAPSTLPLGRCAPPSPQALLLWADVHHPHPKHSTSGKMCTTLAPSTLLNSLYGPFCLSARDDLRMRTLRT